ncbi:MAG TPA: amidohydrolase family protein [Chloroflexota bacterium]|nr:amidohydrolase family protein [Chloroflexota bacterium]
MEYDLLVRGGTVVDGSGQPAYRADVGVRDGKIAAIGTLRGSAARTIDAAGLAVAPGFIDHHTHLDAQILWDPYGTCEPQHGVTSVIMGNCGLTLAPVEPGGEDALVQSFVRVEAMPRVALERGVPWGWRSFGEYLDRLEGHVGVNVGGLVGHIALRHRVLGAEATERRATPEEVAQMQQLVADALAAGALGLSTNRNDRHMREDGKPVASRLADDAELFALGDVLRDANSGVIETILGMHQPEHCAWYDRLARHTRRPVLWQLVVHRWADPEMWRDQLAGIEPTFRAGYRAYGLTNTVPIVSRFDLNNAQVFDEFPTWKTLMFLPEGVRKQAFAEPETRRKLRAEMAAPKRAAFHRRWDLVQIIKTVRPENATYVGQSVAQMAAARGQDPLDAFLDLSLEENLGTMFRSANSGGDLDATAAILRSPYVLVGLSDAGAHVQFDAEFGYGTTLLGLWVRDHGAMSLEAAVRKLTFDVALVCGLSERGLVQPGYAADLTIFDPATVNACEPEWAEDYPAGTRRLVQRSEGIHYTIVNGQVIYADGRLSGDLPGHVLRGPAYRGQPALAS